MKAFQFTMVFLLVLLILFSVFDMAGLVRAVGTLEMGGYGVRTETDINETDEPLIFHGWVKYDGISVLPLKVYLSASADPGEPVLTESEFVFHIPANETYKVYIYVDNIDGNRSVGRLTIVARWEQGVSSGSGGMAMGQYLVRNTNQEEPLVEHYRGSQQNNDVQAIGILILLSMLIALYSTARRRFNKL